jgi:hypothetical protein
VSFSDSVPMQITYLCCRPGCAKAGRNRTELRNANSTRHAIAVIVGAPPLRNVDEIMSSSIQRRYRPLFAHRGRAIQRGKLLHFGHACLNINRGWSSGDRASTSARVGKLGGARGQRGASARALTECEGARGARLRVNWRPGWALPTESLNGVPKTSARQHQQVVGATAHQRDVLCVP